jgi:hypothetical protein
MMVDVDDGSQLLAVQSIVMHLHLYYIVCEKRFTFNTHPQRFTLLMFYIDMNKMVKWPILYSDSHLKKLLFLQCFFFFPYYMTKRNIGLSENT